MIPDTVYVFLMHILCLTGGQEVMNEPTKSCDTSCIIGVNNTSKHVKTSLYYSSLLLH